MVDWNDLKYFLEAIKAGSYIETARRLGVDRTTVARRIQSLERQLDSPLFEQTATGYRPTEIGKHALSSAHEIDKIVRLFLEKANKLENKSISQLRLAVSTELSREVTDCITHVQVSLENIMIEIDYVSNPVEQLKQRKADAILLLTNQPVISTEGILIGQLSASLYTAANIRTDNSFLVSSHRTWVGWTENITESFLNKWMSENITDKNHIIARYNTFDLVKNAVRLGLGTSLLIDTFVSSDDNLIRLPSGAGTDKSNLYLLFPIAVPLDSKSQSALKSISKEIKKLLNIQNNTNI